MRLAYFDVQVAPPLEVVHCEPPEVRTIPCCGSLNFMETIVPVSVPELETSGTRLQCCPASWERNNAPSSPPTHTSLPPTDTTWKLVVSLASTRVQSSAVTGA